MKFSTCVSGTLSLSGTGLHNSWGVENILFEILYILHNSCGAKYKVLYMCQWDSLSLWHRLAQQLGSREYSTYILEHFCETVAELSMKFSISTCVSGTLSLSLELACTTVGEQRIFYLCFTTFLQNSCRAEYEVLYMCQWDSLSLWHTLSQQLGS